MATPFDPFKGILGNYGLDDGAAPAVPSLVPKTPTVDPFASILDQYEAGPQVAAAPPVPEEPGFLSRAWDTTKELGSLPLNILNGVPSVIGAGAVAAQEALAGTPEGGSRLKLTPEGTAAHRRGVLPGLWSDLTGQSYQVPGAGQVALEGLQATAAGINTALGTETGNKLAMSQPGAVARVGRSTEQQRAQGAKASGLETALAVAEGAGQFGLEMGLDPINAKFLRASAEMAAADRALGGADNLAARLAQATPEQRAAMEAAVARFNVAQEADRLSGIASLPGMTGHAVEAGGQAYDAAQKYGWASPEAAGAGMQSLMGLGGVAGIAADIRNKPIVLPQVAPGTRRRSRDEIAAAIEAKEKEHQTAFAALPAERQEVLRDTFSLRPGDKVETDGDDTFTITQNTPLGDDRMIVATDGDGNERVFRGSDFVAFVRGGSYYTNPDGTAGKTAPSKITRANANATAEAEYTPPPAVPPDSYDIEFPVQPPPTAAEFLQPDAAAMQRAQEIAAQRAEKESKRTNERPLSTGRGQDSGVDGAVPEWLRENLNATSATVRPEIKDRIEELAAQRKTAKEIAAELGIDYDAVLAVRIERGIPSQQIAGKTENPEFNEWLNSRQNRGEAYEGDLPENVPMEMDGGEVAFSERKQAARGGEVGINQDFYSGGQFLPSTELPKRYQPRQRNASGMVEVEPFKRVPARPDAEPMLGLFPNDPNRYDEWKNSINWESFGGAENRILLDKLATLWKRGERWVPVKSKFVVDGPDGNSFVADSSEAASQYARESKGKKPRELAEIDRERIDALIGTDPRIPSRVQFSERKRPRESFDTWHQQKYGELPGALTENIDARLAEYEGKALPDSGSALPTVGRADDTILSTINDTPEWHAGLRKIPELREKSGMAPQDFDAAMLRLADEGKVRLEPYTYPHTYLKPEEKASFIKGKDAKGRETYYFAAETLAPRNDGPVFSERMDPQRFRQQATSSLPASTPREAIDMVESLQRELRTDDMTQIGNKKHWKELVQSSDDRDTFVAIDLKKFKTINDRIGHGAGDEVLRRTAAILKRHFGDDSARTGGDEFSALARNTDIDVTRQKAEQIQAELAQEIVTVRHPGTGETIDIQGIESHVGVGRTADEADHATNVAAAPSRAGGRGDEALPERREGERRAEPGTPEETGRGLGDRGLEVAGGRQPLDDALLSSRVPRKRGPGDTPTNPTTDPGGGFQSLQELRDHFTARGVKNFVGEHKGTLTLSQVVVPKDQRGRGIGSEFMRALTEYADRNGKTIALSPSTDFGGSSVGRLREFYKRFGFKDNAGRNKDFTISESMVRPPRENVGTQPRVPTFDPQKPSFKGPAPDVEQTRRQIRGELASERVKQSEAAKVPLGNYSIATPVLKELAEESALLYRGLLTRLDAMVQRMAKLSGEKGVSFAGLTWDVHAHGYHWRDKVRWNDMAAYDHAAKVVAKKFPKAQGEQRARLTAEYMARHAFRTLAHEVRHQSEHGHGKEHDRKIAELVKRLAHEKQKFRDAIVTELMAPKTSGKKTARLVDSLSERHRVVSSEWGKLDGDINAEVNRRLSERLDGDVRGPRAGSPRVPGRGPAAGGEAVPARGEVGGARPGGAVGRGVVSGDGGSAGLRNSEALAASQRQDVLPGAGRSSAATAGNRGQGTGVGQVVPPGGSGKGPGPGGAVFGSGREQAPAVGDGAPVRDGEALAASARGQEHQAGLNNRDANLAKFMAGSKVVDSSGKPLVVYHGTNRDFTVFNGVKSGDKTGNPNAALGFFFTADPGEASRYATDWGKDGGGVKPVYVAIKNPYEMPYREFDDLAMASYKEIGALHDAGTPPSKQQILDIHKRAAAKAAERKAELEAEGYDGISVANSRRGGRSGPIEWIAFRPEQIKSATGNVGTFDPKNPDIRFSTRPVAPDEPNVPKPEPTRPIRPIPLRPQGEKYGQPGGDPDMAPNINRGNLTDRQKAVSEDILKGEQKGLSREEKQAWEDLDPRIKEIQQTLSDEELYKLSSNRSLDAAEVQALKQRVDHKARQVDAARETGDAKEYTEKVLDFVAASRALADDGTGTARALSARKRIMEAAETDSEKFLRKVFTEIKDVTDQQAADLLKAYHTDKSALPELLGAAMKPGLLSRFLYLWRAGLISAVSSHTANLTGGGVEKGANVMETALAAGIDRILQGKTGGPRERFLGETKAELRGVAKAFPGALKTLGLDLKQVIVDGKSPEFDIDKPLAHQMQPFKSKAGRVAGRLAGRVYNALTVEDKFTKSIGTTSELWKQAMRKANGDEKVAALIVNEVLTEAKHTEIIEASKSAGQKLALQEDPGKLVNKLERMASDHPWLSLVFPFIRTPANIAARTIQRSPYGFIEAKRAYDKFKRGEISRGEAADIIARPVLGTLILGGFTLYAKAGGMTGSGPTDEKDKSALRDSGWSPYSFVIPLDGSRKLYIPFNRYEPVSSILGFAADLAEMQDQKKAGDVFDKALGSIASNLTSKSYLQGLSDAASAIANPQQFMGQYASNMAGSLVPNIVNRANQALDPTLRDVRPESTGIAGIPERMSKTIQSRIPGLAQNLPAKKTFGGDDVERGADPLSRFVMPAPYSTTREDKELERYVGEFGITPSKAGRDVTVRRNGKPVKVRLTDDEYALISAADQKAAEYARRLIRNPGFRNRPDTIEEGGSQSKEALIKRYFDRFREEARRKAGQKALRRLSRSV